jgi:tetratricopeptide (TPR) repeat protein
VAWSGRSDDVSHGPVHRSEVSGAARDVVQARDVVGGVHIHHGRPPAHPVPRQLPAAIGDFTARGGELVALDALLAGEGEEHTAAGRAGGVVICAVDGTAGIGKTTLAVHWAHRVRDRFPDGALYTNLRGYGPGRPAEPGEVLDGFLRALGIPTGRIPSALEQRAALYRSLLDSRRVLVVLDNANAPEQVRALLPGTPGCLALITSRSSLTGLAVSHAVARVSLDLLAPEEAVALLRGIVGAARAWAEPEVLARIAGACAYLPLALRIAGQRAAARPGLPLCDVLSDLDDGRERLDVLSSTGEEATAVRAVFASSYRALPAGQARMFRRVGLYPGAEVDVHTAAALADSTPAHARRTLEALAAVHLIEPAGRDRYRAHDLLRAYALERAHREEGAEQREAAVQRMLGFYLHAAHTAERCLGVHQRGDDTTPAPKHPLAFATPDQARAWFQAEYANLTAVMHHAAITARHEVAWKLPVALHTLFADGGHRRDWVAAMQDGLAAVRALGDTRDEGTVLAYLCSALTELQHYEQAIDYAHQALRIAQSTANRTDEAYALVALGDVYRMTRQLEQARDCCQRSVELSAQLGDSHAHAAALIYLGNAYRELYRDEEAVDCHQRALTVFRQTSDRLEGLAVEMLGTDHLFAGRFAQALDHHHRALGFARGADNPVGQAFILDQLAEDLLGLGDREAAIAHWHQALVLFERVGDPKADEVRARLDHL